MTDHVVNEDAAHPSARQWGRTARFITAVLLLIALCAFLYAIRPLLGPLIISALIAYILYPLVTYLQRRVPRFSYQTAVRLVYIPLIILLVIVPTLLTPWLVDQTQALADELGNVWVQVQIYLEQPIIILGQPIPQQQWADLLSEVGGYWTPVPENALHLLETTSTSVVWIIVVLVSGYYLLLDWRKLRDWLIQLAPKNEQSDLQRLLHEINDLWYSYLRGTLFLMFMMAVFFIIIGLVIGLPGAVGLGLLTGLLSIVPEIGPAIAAIVSGLVALFEGSTYLPISNLLFALIVVGIYVVVMQVKSFWIRPLVMGRFMHMNTGVVFVAIVGAAILFGILEALIVLPVMATVGQIGHFIRARLIGAPPWEYK